MTSDRWAAVEAAAVGALTAGAPGGPVRADALRCSAPVAAAERAPAAAPVETRRRGTETAAAAAAAGMGGAAWERSLVDAQRVDAARLLDLGHAAGHLTLAARAARGAGTAAGAARVERRRPAA